MLRRILSTARPSSSSINLCHHKHQSGSLPPIRTKYSNKVEERYKSATSLDGDRDPRVGKLDKKAHDVGFASVGSGACGDMISMTIKITDEGTIIDAKYKAFGCGSAIASSSYATEYLIGKTLTDAESLTNRHIASELSLPPVKLHCSLLAEDAVKNAVKNWRSKRETESHDDAATTATAADSCSGSNNCSETQRPLF